MIKVIKLVSGEEVIAKIEESKEGVIKLFDPLQFMQVPMEEGGVGIHFMPWLAYANIEDGVEIKEDKIIYNIKAGSEVEKQYKEITGEIIVPDSDIIV
jgi:hypothetical protein